ncbi:hypothetical protein BH11BAC1_BH11BAC1_04670 [soil metagenome]
MKKLLKIAMLTIATFINQLSIGQNLVPNCSFEDSLNCPSGWTDFSVKNWYSPTLSSPDYFNSCNSSNVGVPVNALGYQNAKTGHSYAGWAVFYDSVNASYREYIQVQLKSPLVGGLNYYIAAYFSKPDSVPIALKNFGLYLSDTPVGGSFGTPINVIPQIISSQFLTDTLVWTKLFGMYNAVGGEQYLTIGYFNYNNTIDTINLFEPYSFGLIGYYFVDDVCISLDSTQCSCDTSNSINKNDADIPFQIFQNNDDKIILYCNVPEAQLNIYDLLGRTFIKTRIYLGENIISLNNLYTGIYFIESTNDSLFLIKKIFIH